MKKISLAVLGCCLITATSFAQMGGGSPPNPGAAFSKFFGNDLAFSATSRMVAKGMTMEASFALSGGKVRNEMDMSKMTGIPPEAVGTMKQMGMDKMVMIHLPDKKASYIIYPGMQSYVEMPSNDAPTGKEAKIDKTKLGEETIDGHACIKYKMTITDDGGKKSEGTVWEATDLKNFPIQYQTNSDEGVVTMTFRDINQTKPADSLFELPAGYKKYNSVQQMMMQRMMGQ